MPKLYLEEYARAISGQAIFIACREGILRGHFQYIIEDIKFLSRFGARTLLFHNMPNRFANQKLIRKLETRLPDTTIVRISPEADFYAAVLDYQSILYKVIFLERHALIDFHGDKINAITTGRVRQTLEDFGDLIANVNFKGAMTRICQKIESGHCDRAHILPAGKDTIKHELFTVEGTGTLIANNFEESFHPVETDDQVDIVFRILAAYRREGFLKPRSKAYIREHRGTFFVTMIDGIVVGCVEQKVIDEKTVELGAVAISARFLNQRVGVYTVKTFMARMAAKGYTRFISLTNNPRLEALYTHLGFSLCQSAAYAARQAQSPGVKMFFKTIEPEG